ncbi:hypothetical protein H4S02_000656 [Coemansia sp. RSA 2611]|nr:hypothetical protein H4S02_000656 [Coemansia sp. RSA 2611]
MLVLLEIPCRCTVEFDVCDRRPLDNLYEQAKARLGDEYAWDTAYIAGRHGLSASEAMESLDTPWLSLRGRILGGKGGFGSQLRSQGSRTGTKPNDFDDCRDLYGRRLRTLKEAKSIVEKLETDEKTREDAAERRRKKIAEGLREKPAKKHRFDDSEYSRNCEEIVESTKATTRRTLREKLRKQKMAEESEADKSEPSGSSTASSTSKKASPTTELLVPLFNDELNDGSSSSDSSSDTEDEAA